MMSSDDRERSSSRRTFLILLGQSQLLTNATSCHIFYEKRMIDIEDGLTKWSGMDERSDRLDDHGNRIQQ